MNLKKQLLKPALQTAIKLSLFGAEYPVRHLTASRLNLHDKAIKKHQADQDGEALNTCSAQLVLDSLVDEDNQPMADSITPEQLMDLYSPVQINDAVSAITRLNFLGEEAEQAAKKG